MPIFLTENEALKGNRYKLPKYMRRHLDKTLHAYGQYTDAEGAKRLRSLLDKDYNNRSNSTDDSFSFAELKRWNHELRHCDKSDKNIKYALNGGDEALSFTSDLLRKDRSKVAPKKGENAVPEVNVKNINTEVKPTSNVKPTAADSVDECKKIKLTQKQLNILKEYRNELTIPFDGNPRKENYLQFIDWLEEIGEYGQLPSSNVTFNDFLGRGLYEYVFNEMFEHQFGMFDNLLETILVEVAKDNFDDFESVSTMTFEKFKESLGCGCIERAYDSLTQYGLSLVKEHAMHVIEEELSCLPRMLEKATNERGLIYIERAIEIPPLLSKEISTHIQDFNNMDLYTYLLHQYRNHVGTCWSYVKGRGCIYNNNYDYTDADGIRLHAYVDLKDVNIDASAWLSLYDLNEEEELRIKQGGKLEIFAITTFDGKHFPLKKPIIVQA